MLGRENANTNGLARSIEFRSQTVERLLEAHSRSKDETPEIIFADPPRAGLGGVVKYLDDAERLLLVSCHLPSMVRDTKASFIESLRSGKVVYRNMTRGDTNVRVFGNIAIITGGAVFEVTAGGADKTLNVLFHSVWIKREPGLQFVSWQATRLPD